VEDLVCEDGQGHKDQTSGQRWVDDFNDPSDEHISIV